ncbi:MAG: type II toxin-antitoxin system PemK/MazF family toxin [Nitrospirae bacterium]|nr:type II toxin-antitoxin system PemK/MazF family toxin [Nitrospirota bacterium]MBF0591085.1 type II toxin-antitoxin system PemK/MazF family toxin [Nitrospirota bacterium]
MTLKRGDIVLVPFPFTDLSSQKVRPALVLTPDLISTDVVIAFISSYIQQKVLSTDYILGLGHMDFPATGLKKPSVFRMNKLLTVQRSLIIRRLGKVSPAIQDELDRRLRVATGL